MSEFKDRWIAELRSGTRKQGKGHLYKVSSDSYCCLGVAAECEGVLVKDNKCATGYTLYEGFRNNTAYWGPQEELQQEVIDHDGHKRRLADICIKLNDDKLWSFEQIADWLESVDF